MKNEKLYNELEDIAKRLGLRVLKGKGDFAGGKCKVNNESVIVVNKMKPIEHRLKTLASCFRLRFRKYTHGPSSKNFYRAI